MFLFRVEQILIIKSRRGGYDGRKESITMSMTAFILIVGLVLLAMVVISDAAALLNWMYEQDRRKRINERK